LKADTKPLGGYFQKSGNTKKEAEVAVAGGKVAPSPSPHSSSQHGRTTWTNPGTPQLIASQSGQEQSVIESFMRPQVKTDVSQKIALATTVIGQSIFPETVLVQGGRYK